MSGLNKEGWVMVYNSIDGTDITILESKLNELGIEAITFNHQDSMLTSLNDTNYTTIVVRPRKGPCPCKRNY